MPKDDGAGCSRRVLARQGGVLVDQCECGTLHVTVGMCTLRLPRGAAEALCVVLADALRQLDANRPEFLQ